MIGQAGTMRRESSRWGLGVAGYAAGPRSPDLAFAAATLLMSALWLGVCCCGGCRKEPTRTGGWKPPLDPGSPVALSTPQQAAGTLLEFLRAHLQAIAHGDRELANRYRDRVVKDLLSREDILTRYHSVAGKLAQPEPDVLRKLAESWAAVVSYYADGLELDRMVVNFVPDDASRALVDVPASGPRDQAVIRITCLRDDQQQWHASRLEFATGAQKAGGPPPASSATQPATASAPSGP